MIADYLDRLAGALSFDRALARRVREEIEDHLREAAAADPTEDRRAAERRAIADCGDPRVIAAEFAVVALAKRTRRLGVGIPLVIAGVFIAMKARTAWYWALQWVLCDNVKPVAAVVGSIDGYAFLAAVAGERPPWRPCRTREGAATVAPSRAPLTPPHIPTRAPLRCRGWCSPASAPSR